MRETNVKNAIIFCNRKKDVGIVHRSLQRHGFSVGALHGDMDQHQRTATLDAFRNGTIAFLAASDVAARGLDIPDVSHIFNYDVPIHPEDYIHRIGRTGRAGREGFAATAGDAERDQGDQGDREDASPGDPVDRRRSRAPTRIARGAEDRGRSNGRNRRGSRSSRRGSAAPASATDASDSQRKDMGARAAHKPAATPASPISRHAAAKHQPRREQQPPNAAQHEASPAAGAAKPRILTPHHAPAPSSRNPSPSRPSAAKAPQPSRGGRLRGMGEHVPAFMMRSGASARSRARCTLSLRSQVDVQLA